MNGGLQDVVVERLAADGLADEVEQAVLAALAGDDALETALAASGPAAPAEAGGAGDGDVGPLPAVYLERLEVAGFRGIGAPAVLKVRPGPGLTVVCGRNGSGKSSFAEALEVLLTGTLKRWDQRSADWKGTWRCLHAGDVSIEADFLVEGVNGTVTARRTWPAGGTALEEGTTTVQAVGRPRAGLEAFGWDRAVGEHRPFLSHAELEALLDKPKDLHDQLNDLLELDDLQVAGRRLRDRRLGLDRQVREPKDAVAALIAELGASGDRRAEEAAALLRARRPDLDALDALAVGITTPADDVAEILGQLVGLSLPDQTVVEEAAGELEAAARAMDEAGSSTAATALASGELLRLALQLLEWARQVTNANEVGWGPSWPRAATFLTRAALEDALGTWWSGPLAPLAEGPYSTQLLCLPTYLEEPTWPARCTPPGRSCPPPATPMPMSCHRPSRSSAGGWTWSTSWWRRQSLPVAAGSRPRRPWRPVPHRDRGPESFSGPGARGRRPPAPRAAPPC